MMKTTVTVQMKHLFCSQVNPEEKIDSTEVLTVPVSFSSCILHLARNSWRRQKWYKERFLVSTVSGTGKVENNPTNDKG